MDDKVLMGRKVEVYVILKILKYCTGCSARSYQYKFAVQQALINKNIVNMEKMELGAAIKELIFYKTIRGKFSSVHPDLAAEGITKVEVGEEGLFFIKKKGTTGNVMIVLKGLPVFLFRWRDGRFGKGTM